jgi:NAD(P)-dependent dehydrogenase (short-subunit alcohol dehydrogenase family)
MADVAKRVVLITGAAGDIGLATARRFGEDGASLVLTDRRWDALERAGRSLGELGLDASLHACDQTDPGAVARLFEDVAAQGDLQALFVNAGYGRAGPLADIGYEDWRRHIEINLNGSFLVLQHAAKAMIAAGKGGSIVINASTAARSVCDLLGAYAASKAGLAMLGRSLASELGGHRIRVNLILPGVIETAMTKPLLEDPATRLDLLANTPAGRLGGPGDIADLVFFLSSDAAAYITGAEILIDGGQTLHGYPRWFRSDYSEGGGAWIPASGSAQAGELL